MLTLTITLTLTLVVTLTLALAFTTRRVYRGVKLELQKNYVVGQTVMWWAFSSTTCDPKVSE